MKLDAVVSQRWVWPPLDGAEDDPFSFKVRAIFCYEENVVSRGQKSRNFAKWASREP